MLRAANVSAEKVPRRAEFKASSDVVVRHENTAPEKAAPDGPHPTLGSEFVTRAQRAAPSGAWLDQRAGGSTSGLRKSQPTTTSTSSAASRMIGRRSGR